MFLFWFKQCSSVIKTGRKEGSLLPYFYRFQCHYPLELMYFFLNLWGIGPFVPMCSDAPELYACARQLELAPLFHFNMLIFLCNGTTKQTYTFIVVNYTKQQKSIVFYGFCRIIFAVLFPKESVLL